MNSKIAGRDHDVRESLIPSVSNMARPAENAREKYNRYHREYNHKHPERHVWSGMIRRCYFPELDSWENYGGRGITVCRRWHVFENFLADMGPRPSPKHSIDRINNDGNYEPGNCQWATNREQSLNTRATRFVTHDGLTLPLAEWADKIGMPSYKLRERIAKGWTVAQILSGEYRPGLSPFKLIEYDGKKQSVSEWARYFRISREAMRQRIARGWPLKISRFIRRKDDDLR